MSKIVLSHIDKFYGENHVLRDINLTIEDGDFMTLLGPSGCGKTTTLRVVSGLEKPQHGTMTIDDKPMIDADKAFYEEPSKRGLNLVFQSYALWPHMTLAENVAFGLRMRGVGKAETAERVRKALAAVKMEDKASRKPNQLSGGQQQRVALARALVVQPRCLLLDEPLSNLDAKLRLEMRGEIRRICKEAGLTAVYVTHDQKEALSIADRLAVMQAGRLEQVGAPLEVYRKPKNRFVASFIGETNFLPPDFFGSQASFPGAAALSVRPETIRLGKPPAFSKALRLSGTIHGTVYLGETAEHLLDTGAAGVPELKVFELNPEVLARDESRRVEAWVAPSDVVPLPA